jgi:pentatricopeptide repeat protein
MNACVGLGYVDEARAILREMQAGGMRPDVRCYNTLLAGHARAGGLEPLQALLADMRAALVAPSVVTYNILIDAYASAGWLEQARFLPCALALPGACMRPHKLGHQESMPFSGCPYCMQFSMGTAIWALFFTVVWGTCRQAAEACEQAHAEGLELDVWSYAALIKGYCGAERLPEAMRTLAAMQRAGVTPNVVRGSTEMHRMRLQMLPLVRAQVGRWRHAARGRG